MKNLSIAFLAAASLFTAGACKKKGGDYVAKMTEFKDAMCKCTDKACVDKVQADFLAYDKTIEKAAEPDKATQEKLMTLVMDMQKCGEKAMGAPEPAAGSAAPTGDGSGAPAAEGSGDGSAAAADGSAAPAAAAGDLPAECQEYQAAIESLAKCDKLPDQAKDALKKAYEQQAAAWANVPAEGKAALATGCKSAADAVKQSAAVCN